MLLVAQVPILEAQPLYLAESPVKLTVTLHRTSSTTETSPDADGLVVQETRIETQALLTEADVLAEMVARELIPTAEGHALVAVWAAWPDADPFQGSSFRFFVRNLGAKRNAIVKVPVDVLALTPQDWLQNRDLRRLRGGNISGTARYESYSKFEFSVGGHTADLLGRDTGSGLYRSPARYVRNQYLPVPSEMTMSGSAEGGLMEARLAFGPARFVRRESFPQRALPPDTGSGGWLGSFSGSVSLDFSASWSVWVPTPPPPTIEYFCPVSATLVLRHQERGPFASATRDRTRILSSSRTENDLLAGALAEHGVTDPSGWRLFLHEYGDEYTSFANLRLIAAHSDGRVRELSTTPGLIADYSGAEQSRRTFLNSALQTAQVRRLSHLSHDRDWQVPGGTLTLLLNGRAEIESSFDIVAELPGVRYHRPDAATFTLYGSYELAGKNGLADVVFTVSPPLAQSELPPAWLNRIPRDKSYGYWAPYWDFPIFEISLNEDEVVQGSWRRSVRE